jgi:hypothetical protein
MRPQYHSDLREVSSQHAVQIGIPDGVLRDAQVLFIGLSVEAKHTKACCTTNM